MKKILELISKYPWIVLVVVLLLAIALGGSAVGYKYLEKQIERLEAEDKLSQEKIAELEKAKVEADKKVKAHKETIEEIMKPIVVTESMSKSDIIAQFKKYGIEARGGCNENN